MSKKNAVNYDEVFRYLSEKNRLYAEECTDSTQTAIGKFSENIRLQDGVLFYLQYERKEKQTAKSKRLWITKEQKQKQILKSLQNNPLGAGANLEETNLETKLRAGIFGMGILV